MTALRLPDVRLHASWSATIVEFGQTHIDGSGIFGAEHPEPTEDGCRAFVAARLADGDPARPVAEGWVHCSYRWIVEGDELVGFLALRHSLTPYLREEGGHIGYAVRPSRRREGHASRALGRALPLARELGIGQVLVTCDESNEGSRRTIERNGGGYEDSRNGKRRYWIET